MAAGSLYLLLTDSHQNLAFRVRKNVANVTLRSWGTAITSMIRSIFSIHSSATAGSPSPSKSVAPILFAWSAYPKDGSRDCPARDRACVKSSRVCWRFGSPITVGIGGAGPEGPPTNDCSTGSWTGSGVGKFSGSGGGSCPLTRDDCLVPLRKPPRFGPIFN